MIADCQSRGSVDVDNLLTLFEVEAVAVGIVDAGLAERGTGHAFVVESKVETGLALEANSGVGGETAQALGSVGADLTL